MHVSQELIERAERALSFEPRAARRSLAERSPSADADAAAVQRRLAEVLGEGAPGSAAADVAIERILYGADQLNVNFLERGLIAADAVARVEVYDEESEVEGYGTGFMISPRLLLTNHHVLASPERAAVSWVDFRHEFDALGRPVQPSTFALDPAAFFFTDPQLDVTVVAVASHSPDGAERVASFGWLRLSPSEDTVLPGEWLSVVHHPGGRPKQVALRQNLLITATDRDAWYVTETATGTAGAPVFNDAWQVVAVHCGGAPARDRTGEILTLDGAAWTPLTDESQIVWRASVGTRASAIVRRLAAACGDHPFVRELLSDGDVDAAEAIIVPLGSGTMPALPLAPTHGNGVGTHVPESTLFEPAVAGNGNGAGGRSPHETAANESITVTVPLRITVRASETGGRTPVVGVDLS